MLGLSWANSLGAVSSPVLAALLLAACASGDGGLSGSSSSPFTTNPSSPSPTSGMTDPTDGASLPTTGGTEGDDVSASTPSSISNSEPSTPGDTEDPTSNPDPDCQDADGDGFGVDCDIGSDCDDDDYNNHTPEGCANCKDLDGDNWWVGCDQYGEEKPGPDCDDDNPEVEGMDAEELCNGIAENCAGEIDPLPADQMCPTTGTGDHVAGVGGWKCNPVMPGEDGCEVAACEPGYYDADKGPGNGCECAGTSRDTSLDACGDAPAGFRGDIAEGGSVGMIKGTIPFIDNGPGLGLEDWYVVNFPEAMAQGVRPNAGNIVVNFSTNPGDPANPDYRLEVYRACNGAPFDMGLATTFGAGAPPAREWSFFDNHPNPGNPMYKNDIAWPERVYIRVIRTNNSGVCGEYTLNIARTAN